MICSEKQEALNTIAGNESRIVFCAKGASPFPTGASRSEALHLRLKGTYMHMYQAHESYIFSTHVRNASCTQTNVPHTPGLTHRLLQAHASGAKSIPFLERNAPKNMNTRMSRDVQQVQNKCVVYERGAKHVYVEHTKRNAYCFSHKFIQNLKNMHRAQRYMHKVHFNTCNQCIKLHA